MQMRLNLLYLYLVLVILPGYSLVGYRELVTSSENAKRPLHFVFRDWYIRLMCKCHLVLLY